MVSQYLMQFLQVSEYMVRRYSGVLIGISVKISRIDRFSSSVICGQITEGSYLSIMHLLIGSRLQIFYWNIFRHLPIDKYYIDWFSSQIIWGQIFLDTFRLIIIKTTAIPLNPKSRSWSVRICFSIFNKLRYFWLRPPYAAVHKYMVPHTPRGTHPDNPTTTASSLCGLPGALPYEYKPCARYCAPDDSSGVLRRPLPINPIPSAHCMPLPGSRDRRYPFSCRNPSPAVPY